MHIHVCLHGTAGGTGSTRVEDGGPEWIQCLGSDWLSNSRQNTEKCFLVEGMPFPGRLPGHWWSQGTGPCTRKRGYEQPPPYVWCGGDSSQRILVFYLGEGVPCQNLFLCDTHVSEPVCVTYTCAEKALRPRITPVILAMGRLR